MKLKNIMDDNNMSDKDKSQNGNSGTDTKKVRSYSVIYNEQKHEARKFRDSIDKQTKEYDASTLNRLAECIASLKREGKEKETIRDKIKEDWVTQGFCKKSLMFEALQKVYNPEKFEQNVIKEKERLEKKKLLVEAASGQIIEDTNNEKSVENMTPSELREYYKKQNQAKTMKKATNAIQKQVEKPNIVGSDSFDNDDVNDNDDNNSNVTSNELDFAEQPVTATATDYIKAITIDHEDDYNLIIDLIKKGYSENKEILLHIDTRNWKLTGGKVGSGDLKKS